MKSKRGENDHKRQGTAYSTVRPQTQECGRPVCIPHEQEGESLLQLVPRHQIVRPECTVLQLVRVQQPIQLPTMEPDLPICYLVFGPIVSVDLAAGPSANNDDHTGSKKWKVATLRKQELALDGLEDQRRFLESQCLDTYAVDFILFNERCVRRRSRYSSVQQRFLDRRISKEIADEILATQIINYLVEIYTVDKIKVVSIKAYNSALLRLVGNPTKLSNHPMFSEFTKTLGDASIKSYVRPVIDISQVLDLFKEWGPSTKLSNKASDIHRIDDEHSQLSLSVLNLVIIAPKEKRSGRPIEKTIPDKPSHRSDSMPSNSIFGV
ncbi:hypothetical protein AYI70_g123 [Smittium culicis]|uniref:Uncharacterized protein n=1 Tax=Smittium culicis TaxID=133412 RepID=A0A1R1YHW7_9FUNG|nr:hypothetical protein AYI70_g123 [Smittium culicis]